ncbi:unnamed protein product [Rodentolepis nana]|uniref:Uncharacterized protein n=1 Tax=Rodentolepis nana TaxID=102285 RepID=A0A3P7SWG4_RODNA|nr:unnamed protein product [Rodentolepis nana]
MVITHLRNFSFLLKLEDTQPCNTVDVRCYKHLRFDSI